MARTAASPGREHDVVRVGAAVAIRPVDRELHRPARRDRLWTSTPVPRGARRRRLRPSWPTHPSPRRTTDRRTSPRSPTPAPRRATGGCCSSARAASRSPGWRGTRMVESKVGQRHVQGRTKAGGQSQQRFARRRDNQARVAYEAAAEHAARILDGVPAVVTGGDHAAVEAVLSDRRLAGLVRRAAVPGRARPASRGARAGRSRCRMRPRQRGRRVTSNCA